MTARARGNGVFRAAVNLAILALMALPQAALALTGQITNLSGAVVARGADGVSRILSIRSEVIEGDELVTADNSYARVKFTDGSEVVMRPGTQIKIDAFRFEDGNPDRDSFVVSLLKGGMRSVTGLLGRRNPGRASYNTPTATIGIRGTHFGALVCNNDCASVPSPTGSPPANGLHVDVADGRIVVTTAAGALEFSLGQFGYVASSTVVPVTIPASQGIRETLPPQAIVATMGGGGGVGRAGELECVIR
ncbi:MAG: hypothetical protein EXR33_09700 [Betaproteobacteria bacterium]|nr:hypothetical protein [Betaproteobacteria bacterium]